MGNLNVLGLRFEVETRFVEGHKCNANEAAALQQTFLENLRNNKSKRIKEVIDEKGGGDPLKIPKADLDALQNEITEYAKEYEFYPSPARISDPIESLSRKTAWEIAKEALRRNPSIKMKDITEEDKNRYIDDVLNKNPKIKEYAKQQIALQQDMMKKAVL